MSDTPDDTASPDASDSLGDAGADAFLTSLMAATGEPSDASAEAVADTAEPDAEAPETGADKAPDPDDAEVDVGEAKAKLRDLKAAYTAKAEMEATRAAAAEARAIADADAARANAAMNRALEKAKARWEPFAKVDFLALSRDPSISSEDFTAIRKEAADALADLKFVTEELDGSVRATAAQASAWNEAQAKATVTALADPTTGIPGWSASLYGEMLAYADTVGAPKGVPQQMTAEWALRALHKAMLYDRGVAATATKMEAVKAKPVRVLNSSSAAPSASSATKTAMEALRRSGSTDDAADAFFASATA